MKKPTRKLLSVFATAACLLAGAGAQAQTKVVMWSHFADHQAVRSFMAEVEKRFEAANPGADLEINYYEKGALFAAQSTAFRAGTGPDIFYLEPDRKEYLTNGFALALDDLIDWSRVEDYAQEVWTWQGKKYALGMQALTVELYYNKALLEKIGAKLPADATPTQAQFLEWVKKARAAGIDPIVQGIGDRPYPGSYLLHEQLLRMLGKEDYAALWAGKLSFKDPRVVKVFDYVKQVVDAGAYPKTFMTLKLGESHTYFHTRPGGLFFPLGSWYASRAFNPPDKGGQPDNFPLGVMQFPKMDGGSCPDCKTVSVAGSYAINVRSKNPKLAAKVLDTMTTPDMANLWLSTVFVQTGARSGDADPSGEHADYFKELSRMSKGRTWFIGTPLDFITGQCKDTFVQVLNAALPGGLMGPKDAIEAMDAACYKK